MHCKRAKVESGRPVRSNYTILYETPPTVAEIRVIGEILVRGGKFWKCFETIFKGFVDGLSIKYDSKFLH